MFQCQITVLFLVIQAQYRSFYFFQQALKAGFPVIFTKILAQLLELPVEHRILTITGQTDSQQSPTKQPNSIIELSFTALLVFQCIKELALPAQRLFIIIHPTHHSGIACSV